MLIFTATQDYLLLVAIPMDLGTVRSKLIGGQYCVPKELIQDIKLIFANAKAYNEPRSRVRLSKSGREKKDERVGFELMAKLGEIATC